MRATDLADCAAVPRAVHVLARLIPAADRDSILGDLLEDVEHRRLRGRGRVWWLMAECAAIAAGLSIERVHAWLVLPPVREVATGLAVDGRAVWRGDVSGFVLRCVLFCASVATLALAVELMVRTLMTAAGL
jgi:hypothetical protein